MKLRLIALACMVGGIGPLRAQVCTIQNEAVCGTSGTLAGPPTLQNFVQTVGSSMLAGTAGVAGSAQPRMVWSAQLKPASQLYMLNDPRTCGGPSPTGTCNFNNISAIEAYATSLTATPPHGVGLKELDINIWLGPFFEASQWAAACASYGGGSCSPAINNSTAGWYARSLATYDAVFAWLAAHNIKVDVAPVITPDVAAACGVVAPGYTEAQLQNCLAPLVAVVAGRYSINNFSVAHEPCGSMPLELGVTSGCVLSVADMRTLLAALSAAVRATRLNAAMLVGAGAAQQDVGGGPYSCANVNYWCDWVTNLTASLDYYSVHAYPGGDDLPLTLYGAMAAAVPSNRIVVADESSALRWGQVAGQGTGEGATIWGCGDMEWVTDGTFAAWARAIPGAWAPAHNIRRWSLFTSDLFIRSTVDHSNNHCTLGSDNYDYWLTSYYGQVSPSGLMYAALAAGWSEALQGNAHTSGGPVSLKN